MLFGYYDRNGYPYMYTGPANGGVAPLTDLGQGIDTPIAGACSIIATQKDFDGRSTRGHVDDYWISYNSPGPDPWVSNNWTEHTWGGCTADYLGTKQGEVMALGDSDADVPMIEWAGIGVAMGNANATVRAAADFITASNSEDGVAAAIEKFVLG